MVVLPAPRPPLLGGRSADRFLGSGKARKSMVVPAVIAVVVCKTGLGEKATRRREACDPAARDLMPSDVERRELREELQFAVRKMVVYPPRHCLPGRALFQTIDQPRNDNRGHGPHSAVGAALVPDVIRAIRFVRRAIVEMLVSERVDFRRTIGRPHREAPERCLQRLKQIFAKTFARGDREIGIAGHVCDVMDIADVAVEKVPHEKRL
jgi:hypothetical protein